MGEISNGESFHANSDSTLLSNLVGKFKAAQDTILQGGRQITIHLPPEKTRCVAGCRFNSTYNKFINQTGGICTTCKGQGYSYESRYTTYTANIRQVNENLESIDGFGQDTPAGRISQRLARTRTVIESYAHVIKSIGVTIDGEAYKLHVDPEKTGFGGTLLYVVAFWKKMDK